MSYVECHKTIDEIDHKLCNTCYLWFPCDAEHYYKNNKNKMDGFNPYCKKCAVKKSTERLKEPRNRENHLIALRKNAKRPNIILGKRKNSELRRKNGKREEYYKNNPARFKKYGKTRSSKKHDISKLEWDECKLFFDNSCAYCGLTWVDHKKIHKQDLHKEHAIHNGADDLSNCIPSCKTCNSEKWEYSLNVWYNEKNIRFSQTRLDKINLWLNEKYKEFFGLKIIRKMKVKYK